MPSGRNKIDPDKVPDDNILKGVAELNLGRTAQLQPGGAQGEAGNEVKLVMLPEQPESGRPQVCTVHIATFTPNLNGNPNGVPVGIVEFSAGGAKLGRIEFDIPASRPFPPDHRTGTTDRRGLNNGVSVSIPFGGGQVLARNDARIGFITDPSISIGGAGNNVEASAHISRFPINFNNLRRVIYVAGPNATLADGASASFGIPNYARSVWFPRNPMSSVLEVTTIGTIGGASVYTIPAGAVLPTPDFEAIKISPDDFTMTVRNITGGGVSVDNLQAVFELAL